MCACSLFIRRKIFLITYFVMFWTITLIMEGQFFSLLRTNEVGSRGISYLIIFFTLYLLRPKNWGLILVSNSLDWISHNLGLFSSIFPWSPTFGFKIGQCIYLECRHLEIFQGIGVVVVLFGEVVVVGFVALTTVEEVMVDMATW